MKTKLLSVLFLLVLHTSSMAQLPAEILDQWSAKSPIEKAYLHFDRENYLAGETIWFKAYLYSDYQPDVISTTLYVELLRDSVNVLTRSVLPIFLGSANGQIELPDTLHTGNYTVRAYTATMLNLPVAQTVTDAAFIFSRELFIYGKNKTTAADPVISDKTIVLNFFPEGGNLIRGFNNSVAFKATDKKGMPVTVSGTIWNEKNEEVTTFNSYHDGMGLFELLPVATTSYYAQLNGDASGKKYTLPASIEKGIALTLLPHPQGHFFELQQKTDDPAFRAAYMIGQMQHHVVFRQNFTSAKEQIQGVINTQNLYSGILQITFFNKDNMPLAERLCFVNNKEFILPMDLSEDSIDFSVRAKNKFTLHFKDTVQGSFSVSVTDQEYNQGTARDETIFTNLLLTSDIKGYVHRPAYYFSAETDSVKTATDLLMMTNGWRRFSWEQLLQKPLPAPGYKDKAFITLGGKATLQGTKKPFADKELLVFITGTNGKRSTQMLKTNSEGGFLLDSMIFFERTRILFSDIRGKKSQYIDIMLNGDSVRRLFPLPVMNRSGRQPEHSSGVGSRWKMDYDAILKANGILLEEIKLTSRKKDPLAQVDERYTTGLFSGDAIKSIDLVNSDEANVYQNIFDYLQARVNGLQINADGFDYSVYYRQSGASISSMGAIPMALFLDEVETDASVIASIPASQVALVKVYNTFAGAWGNAPGGVLSVYTKKGQDYINSAASTANHRVYNGYTVIKEFYSPDYKLTNGPSAKDESKADNRITLLWRPNIILNSIDPDVPVSFYNNDRTRQYRIVVEGLTASGKMVSFEKIITPAKKSF